MAFRDASTSFAHLIIGQIVEPMPPEISICEFDCRKTQCGGSEWAICERRMNLAAGKLMPTQQVQPIKRVS